MSYKQIEGARELRLWICQIIGPAAIAGFLLYQDPDIKSWTKKKIKNIRAKIDNRKQKRVSE